VDYRVLAVSYLALLIIYIYSLRRERKKRVLRKRWKPDWIDKFHTKADALINRKPIRPKDVEGGSIRGPSEEVPGENGEGSGQGEDKPTGEVVPQDDGG
jgi:hypothetical protein